MFFSFLQQTTYSQHLDTYDIPQRHLSAAYDLLSLSLSDSELDQVLSHGCWCQRINPDSDKKHLGGAKTVDSLDSICKDWANVRHCNGLSGGSCQDGKFFSFQYTIGQSKGKWTCKYNKSQCLRDTCKIDTYFLEKIEAFLKKNKKWGAKNSVCGAHVETTTTTEKPRTTTTPRAFIKNDKPEINNGMAVIENPLEYFSTLAEKSKGDSDKTSNVFGEKMKKLLEENEKRDEEVEKESKIEPENKPGNYLISNPLEYFSKLSEEKETTKGSFGNKMQGLLNEMGAAKEKKDFLNTVFEEQVDENDLPFFMSNHEDFFGGAKEKEEEDAKTRSEPEISFDSGNTVHVGGVEDDGPRTVCMGKVPNLSIIHLNNRRRR